MGRFGTLTFALLLLSLTSTRAGLYSPDEPPPVPVTPDGKAGEIGFGPRFEGPFAVQLGTLMNYADPRRADNTDRQKLLKRIEELRNKRERTPDEIAALAVAYLRAGETAEPLNLLAPLSRSRTPDFRVLANLAHTHAVRGEWDEAVRWHQSAVLDTEFPADLAGSTPEQRKWLLQVERQYYAKWLRIHRDRARERRPPEQEEIFPLFDVKFVGESGRYEPGQLAAAEKAKLPPDAIPIVQQLLIWAPWDTGLYWLLAELYAADGRVQPADTIFFQCANSRQYSNRQLLMEHRHAVAQAAEADRRNAPAEVPLLADDPPAGPKPDNNHFLPSREKAIAVGALFGLAVLVLLAMQFRAIRRRLRGHCGPGG